MPRRTHVTCSFILGLSLLLSGCVSKPKPREPRPTLLDAMVRLQAKDAAGTAKILDDVTSQEPHNGRAWRTLGLAQLQLKSLDRSREAFQRALVEDPEYPAPMLQLAVIAASRQNRDEAFDWLSKAKATRKVDMTQVEVTPELASLKGDARYKPLLPVRQDFDDPFVEPVKVLGEWDGEHANDQFAPDLLLQRCAGRPSSGLHLAGMPTAL